MVQRISHKQSTYLCYRVLYIIDRIHGYLSLISCAVTIDYAYKLTEVK